MRPRMAWFLLGSAVLFVSARGALAAPSEPLAPHVTPEALARIETLRTGPFAGRNLEALEKEYQELVEPQTLADLLSVYDPENADRVEITYPSFTAERDAEPRETDAGPDLGYGLHVVKRLRLSLPGGKQKIVDVNEQWSSSRETGALFLPDEIRVKTLSIEGERHVEGSERLYLFDSIRIAWGPSGEGKVYRNTRYRWDEEKSLARLRTLRVPVSAPLSCLSCHHAPTRFAPEFAAEGEAISHEAIVQDGYFKRKLDETKGFRDYMAALREDGRDETFIAAAREALLDPKRRLRIPGLAEALRAAIGSPRWLSDDRPLDATEGTVRWQGVYTYRGKRYLDAIDDVIPGKHATWWPRTVVP